MTETMHRFNTLLREMVVRGSPPHRRKSARATSCDSSGTRTPSHTSEGASGTHERTSPGSAAFVGRGPTIAHRTIPLGRLSLSEAFLWI